jgi:trans-aconitate methyltransferase
MEPSFYDKKYTSNPKIWADEPRNAFVCENNDEPRELLDLGCGSGHTIKHLSEKWRNTMFCGIDYSSVAIELANSKKICRSAFDVMKIEDCKLTADLVLCMGVAEHFEDLNQLATLKRFIPKGKLYLEVPNCLINSNIPEEGYRKTYASANTQYEWHLKRETWEEHILKCGYTIVKSLVGKRSSWEFVWILENNG